MQTIDVLCVGMALWLQEYAVYADFMHIRKYGWGYKSHPH